MADHFAEIVDLRIRAIDEKVDSEVTAVRQRFAEERLFVAGGFEGIHKAINVGFATTALAIGRLTDRVEDLEHRMDGLEHRMDGLEDRMDRIENKLDSHLARALTVLEDISRRLPPAM